MNCKRLENKYIVRIDAGEEIITSLKQICQKFEIKLGKVSGIGATNNVTVGLFEPDKKKYYSTKLEEDFEILAITGNITTMNDEVYLHCHISLANKQHKSFGGHLNEAIVSATCEIIIEHYDGVVERVFDEKSKLNLLELE